MADYSNTRIQVRRGSSAEWASANTILASGEPGYDHGSGVLKVGDGVTGWNSLDTLATAGGGGGGGLNNVVEDTSPQLGGNLDLNSRSFVGAAIFNDAGSDVDFRIEGDADQNLFFVDASTDRIGIGTNIPQHTLAVSGTFNANEVNVSGSPAVYSSPTQANNSGIVNISGITNIVLTDIGSYSGIDYDDNTLYFVT
jgi:hypothetical protein